MNFCLSDLVPPLRWSDAARIRGLHEPVERDGLPDAWWRALPMGHVLAVLDPEQIAELLAELALEHWYAAAIGDILPALHVLDPDEADEPHVAIALDRVGSWTGLLALTGRELLDQPFIQARPVLSALFAAVFVRLAEARGTIRERPKADAAERREPIGLPPAMFPPAGPASFPPASASFPPSIVAPPRAPRPEAAAEPEGPEPESPASPPRRRDPDDLPALIDAAFADLDDQAWAVAQNRVFTDEPSEVEQLAKLFAVPPERIQELEERLRERLADWLAGEEAERYRRHLETVTETLGIAAPKSRLVGAADWHARELRSLDIPAWQFVLSTLPGYRLADGWLVVGDLAELHERTRGLIAGAERPTVARALELVSTLGIHPEVAKEWLENVPQLRIQGPGEQPGQGGSSVAEDPARRDEDVPLSPNGDRPRQTRPDGGEAGHDQADPDPADGGLSEPEQARRDQPEAASPQAEPALPRQPESERSGLPEPVLQDAAVPKGPDADPAEAVPAGSTEDEAPAPGAGPGDRVPTAGHGSGQTTPTRMPDQEPGQEEPREPQGREAEAAPGADAAGAVPAVAEPERPADVRRPEGAQPLHGAHPPKPLRPPYAAEPVAPAAEERRPPAEDAPAGVPDAVAKPPAAAEPPGGPQLDRGSTPSHPIPLAGSGAAPATGTGTPPGAAEPPGGPQLDRGSTPSHPIPLAGSGAAPATGTGTPPGAAEPPGGPRLDLSSTPSRPTPREGTVVAPAPGMGVPGDASGLSRDASDGPRLDLPSTPSRPVMRDGEPGGVAVGQLKDVALTRRCFRQPDGRWWFRVDITEDHLAGGPCAMPSGFAAYLGLTPGESRTVRCATGEMTLNWQPRPALDAIRPLLLEAGARAGGHLFVTLSDEGTLRARHLPAPSGTDKTAQALRLVGYTAPGGTMDQALRVIATRVGLTGSVSRSDLLARLRERGDRDLLSLLATPVAH